MSECGWKADPLRGDWKGRGSYMRRDREASHRVDKKPQKQTGMLHHAR